jgi:hypothetical protein
MQVHGVDVEGKKLGIDSELVELLGRWSPVPVTYAGGVRALVSTWLCMGVGVCAWVWCVWGCVWGWGGTYFCFCMWWVGWGGSGEHISVCAFGRMWAACFAQGQATSAPSRQPTSWPGCVQADMELVKEAGGGRVDATVGSALDIFGGSMSYAQLVAWHRSHQ